MNFTLPKRVAILYSDAQRQYFPTEQLYHSEAEVQDRATLIATYFEKMGINTTCFPGDANVVENLKKYQPDFVLNLVDTVYGKEYLAATIPATLELLNIPYTGTGVMGMTINTNKYFTKNLLEQWGITTPKYQLIKDIADEVDISLDFPLITKLNDFHGSIEMNQSAICQDEKELDKRVRYLMDTYKTSVLVEEYVAGREIAVHITEGANIKVYAGEKVFRADNPDKFQICSYDAVWGTEDVYTYIKYELPQTVKEDLKTAFDILKLEDYAKFDLRLDAAGRHYIIDVNANPALGPKPDCSIGTVLSLYDITFEDILTRIMHNTLVVDPQDEVKNNLTVQ